MDPDYTLDLLLDLDGEVLVVDPVGSYWVRFVVTRVPVSAEKPAGIDYSLTLHGPDGERLVGFETLTTFRKKGRLSGKIIVIGGRGSKPTNTGMQQHCLRISGMRWTQFCARKGSSREDLESRNRQL